MWQIMHGVHQQYLYQYITIFKSVFYTEIIRQISYIFRNYTQLTWGVAEKMQLNTVYELSYRAQVMTTILIEISLKIRQRTVLHLRINTNCACSKRLRKLCEFV